MKPRLAQLAESLRSQTARGGMRNCLPVRFAPPKRARGSCAEPFGNVLVDAFSLEVDVYPALLALSMVGSYSCHQQVACARTYRMSR
jgi:hypothetical protein